MFLCLSQKQIHRKCQQFYILSLPWELYFAPHIVFKHSMEVEDYEFLPPVA